MANNLPSLFILLRPEVKEIGSSLIIRRLETDAPMQVELAELFTNLMGAWSQLEQVKFSPSYKPDGDEVFAYADFPVPVDVAKAVANRPQVEEFEKSKSDAKGLVIKGLLAAFYEADTKKWRYYFQLMDRRHVLDKKKWRLMHFFHNKYTAIHDHALTVADHLTAVIDADGKLLFRSYRDASQLLDLTSFFSEATEADIRAMLSNSAIVAATEEEIDKIVSISDASMRVRFSILRFEGTLDNAGASAKSIVDSAKKFGLTISLTGKLPHFKFKFPTKKETLKAFLKHLSHAYYESLITGEQYVSNSHRRHGNATP